jgi:hypothetical protein
MHRIGRTAGAAIRHDALRKPCRARAGACHSRRGRRDQLCSMSAAGRGTTLPARAWLSGNGQSTASPKMLARTARKGSPSSGADATALPFADESIECGDRALDPAPDSPAAGCSVPARRVLSIGGGSRSRHSLRSLCARSPGCTDGFHPSNGRLGACKQAIERNSRSVVVVAEEARRRREHGRRPAVST